MRNKFIIALCLALIGIGMITVAFPDGVSALLIVLILSFPAIFIFRKFTTEREFVTTIFLAALAVRLLLGAFIHVLDAREFFGPDASTYDFLGGRLVDYWNGISTLEDQFVQRALSTENPGWGMYYITAAIYYLFGKNIFAAQALCAVFGAATAPMVYFCSVSIFANKKAAKFAAFAVAFFPAMILWSSQLMKDGLVIFMLVLAITMVLRLQEKFSVPALLLLVLAMAGIFTLRFYIFYMVMAAVVGSFVVGLSGSVPAMARRTAALIIVGLSLTYLGVIRNATVDLDRFGSLERIQASRADLAQTAESGFFEDVDVSTTEGAITILPVGFLYLMFAPFPWEMNNFRQTITLPEVLLWWAQMPFLLSGLIYSLRHRLRNAMPVLLFTVMLTIAYSLFQGNVGTAYRQRTQIQVFLFMFIAVGWVLFKESRENKQLARAAAEKRVEKALKQHRIA